jgi:hypothetical protein
MVRSVTAVAVAVLVSLAAGGCGRSPGGTHTRVTQCPARALAQREAVGISGPAGLSYCRGGPHDPGQLVTVSPAEPTAQAASNLR